MISYWVKTASWCDLGSYKYICTECNTFVAAFIALPAAYMQFPLKSDNDEDNENLLFNIITSYSAHNYLLYCYITKTFGMHGFVPT